MTHTVKTGETLGRIAKANGITLDQLLDANPKFKANPNRVRVGDVLNIPDGGAAPQRPRRRPRRSPTRNPTRRPRRRPRPRFRRSRSRAPATFSASSPSVTRRAGAAPASSRPARATRAAPPTAPIR